MKEWDYIIINEKDETVMIDHKWKNKTVIMGRRIRLCNDK